MRGTTVVPPTLSLSYHETCVWPRGQEATLTRKCKCLLYRSQQVFGFVGAPWMGTMVG
jgi:hypothetical protein